ncbi:MAG: hypothetical protein JXR03_17745 [Cyclobacteriaceae bacterium]
MLKEFENKINEHQAQFVKAKSDSATFSWGRGILFLIAAGTLIYYFSSGVSTVLIVTGVASIGFYYMVIQHRKREEEKTFHETLMDINREEIKRSKLDLHDFDSGEDYIEDNHPYQVDLDIFGKHSVYQLINRCEIDDSRKKLASWLSKPAEEETVSLRQKASKELKEMIDWSQKFQSLIRISIAQKKKRDPSLQANDILSWVKQTDKPVNLKLLKALAYFLGFVTCVVTCLVLLDYIIYQLIYPVIFINGIFLSFGIKRLQKLTTGIDKAHYIISAYAQALELIEKEKFESDLLTQLSQRLVTGRQSATQSIKSLANLSYRISSRANMLYALLDATLLLDIHLLTDLIKWKKANNQEIEKWLNVVNEFECLVSIAGFSRVNESYAYPELEKESFAFETKKMGHPLISGKDKVTNDYLIDGKGSLDIITGSNMSGKSTFQRTVGVNMVLAQAGCPVDAESLRMSRTQVFTSMRTKDNLEEHTSSFYAELKRIVQLLEEVEQNTSTFFILDEILKGTNSEDRHVGSISLAKKLTGKNAFGLISTHDLGLGELGETDPKIRNFSFNSTLENDKIIFDYTLTPGVCKSFNASQLMKNMGIL